MMNKSSSNPDTKSIVDVSEVEKPRGVWSTMVAAKPGTLLFVSGSLSTDKDGQIVGEGDIRAQTEQVILNLQAALEAGGATLQDIVRVDVYVTDIAQFDAIHEVRARYFPSEPPASTMVEVSGFIDDRCLIEMNAIAVVK